MARPAASAEGLDKHEVLARVLALPLSSWSYVWDAEAVRHIGPMAQDFYAAFGLGADPLRIDPLDGQGVALAAIQALHELLVDQQRQIDELRTRVAALTTRDPTSTRDPS